MFVDVVVVVVFNVISFIGTTALLMFVDVVVVAAVVDVAFVSTAFAVAACACCHAASVAAVNRNIHSAYRGVIRLLHT